MSAVLTPFAAACIRSGCWERWPQNNELQRMSDGAAPGSPLNSALDGRTPSLKVDVVGGASVLEVVSAATIGTQL